MSPSQPQVILLLGAPGAGKGTQARFLGEVLGVPHMASGDLLREHRRRGTELGRAAQAFMDRGDLVPDDMVVTMVMERLVRKDAERGVLLDGFPRTRIQATVLDSNLDARGSGVHAAIYLEVPKVVLVDRLAGRWMCGTCQAIYHERFSPPLVTGVCDICSGELVQRPDDRRDVVENRVEIYLRETMPVIQHYAERGVLHRIDGSQAIDAVRTSLCFALGGAVHGQRRDRWHLLVLHDLAIDRMGAGRWLGRTLCGKFVRHVSGHPFGTREEFDALPCRECLHIVRGHGLRDGPTDGAANARATGVIVSIDRPGHPIRSDQLDQPAGGAPAASKRSPGAAPLHQGPAPRAQSR